MQQRWHWLRLRSTCHPTEDVGKVRQALQTCTGLDDDGFAKCLTETELDSHHGGQVILLEATLERAREIRAVLGQLPAEDCASLIGEVESRTDDHGVFHCRIGKQAAYRGKVGITRGDDAIQMRLKPEVHPSSREAAVAAVSQWFAATQ